MATCPFFIIVEPTSEPLLKNSSFPMSPISQEVECLSKTQLALKVTFIHQLLSATGPSLYCFHYIAIALTRFLALSKLIEIITFTADDDFTTIVRYSHTTRIVVERRYYVIFLPRHIAF
ncbi:hypothetical protein ACJX0J_005410 [Zea mays]